MKKLIGLGILGLFLSGCKEANYQKEHDILCFDPTNFRRMTVYVTTPKNVVAAVVKGHSVLIYRDSDDDDDEHIILLMKNDCEIY